MRAFRLVLGLALAAMVVTVWQRRAPVVSAYADEREPVQFEFDGLAFEAGRQADLGPSPLVIPRAPDTSASNLLALDLGAPTASTQIPSGGVVISGTVRQGAAPAPGAVVRLERHAVTGTSPTVATADLIADEFGHYELAGVAGGRWRVRAFVPSELASVDPFVGFVDAGSALAIDLAIAPPNPSPVLTVNAPETTYLGDAASVALSAGVRRVDADGVVVIDPLVGAVVTLLVADGAPAQPVSALTATTNGLGATIFGVRCDALGASNGTFSLVAEPDLVGNTSANLPICIAVPPPEPEVTEDGGEAADE